MRRFAAAVAIASLCLGCWMFGSQMIGRALLSFGLPSAATAFFEKPAWQGVACYAAGRWDEAASAFARDVASAYNLGNALARAGRYEDAIAAYDRALAADAADEDAVFNKTLLTEALLQEQRASGAGAVSANSAASRAGSSRERPQTGGDTTGSGDGMASGREGESRPGGKGSKASKSGKGESESADAGNDAATGAAGASEGAGRAGGLQVDVAELLHESDRRVQRRLDAGSVQPSPEWLSALLDDPGRFLKLRILAEKARRLRAASGPPQDDDR